MNKRLLPPSYPPTREDPKKQLAIIPQTKGSRVMIKHCSHICRRVTPKAAAFRSLYHFSSCPFCLLFFYSSIMLLPAGGVKGRMKDMVVQVEQRESTSWPASSQLGEKHLFFSGLKRTMAVRRGQLRARLGQSSVSLSISSGHGCTLLWVASHPRPEPTAK